MKDDFARSPSLKERKIKQLQAAEEVEAFVALNRELIASKMETLQPTGKNSKKFLVDLQ